MSKGERMSHNADLALNFTRQLLELPFDAENLKLLGHQKDAALTIISQQIRIEAERLREPRARGESVPGILRALQRRHRLRGRRAVNSPFLEHRVPELLDEVVAMYRAAGRPLASLTDGDLDAYFVDTVEAYIADPRNPARFRTVNDGAAEYVLRRRAAPVERVLRLTEEAEEDAEIAAINQPHKPKLTVVIGGLLRRSEDLDLPMVVLAFGRYAVIPAIGAIACPEGNEEELDSWNKNLSEAERERANQLWRKERAERDAEFRWLLGLSPGRVERVVNLDAARAKRVAGNSH